MKFQTIKEINEKVKSCTSCDLCKSRTNAVPGIGDQHSEIILVGEAPGRFEDKKGEPFVGPAGRKLTEALEHAGLSRKSVYITNVLKCRPPKNRIPTTEEKNSCREFLDSEIKIINPKIVCIMGNTAYNLLLGGGNVTKNRGKCIIKEGINYFITVHPAATIYNKKLLQKFKEDLINLVKIKNDMK